jgi:hypothetical protein
MLLNEKTEGIVKQKITADFILDLYEKYKNEKNKIKRKEIEKKLILLSKNLNQYLVMPKNFDKYYE